MVSEVLSSESCEGEMASVGRDEVGSSGCDEALGFPYHQKHVGGTKRREGGPHLVCLS